ALDNAALIEKFQQAYEKSLAWCEKNPDECGRLVAGRSELLTAEGVADSVRVDNSAFVPARQARAELEFFFGVLLQREPNLVGGKLPDDAFYGQ
ncbi:MAG: ABC transporter substrate-binding protein, partial [Rhodocyclaceae bacterium]|nr:ABC transporter substrate-binding protein [Rhodocyclaceae bacterium]